MESENEIRKAKIEYDNWMVSYKFKPQLERVVWKSKLYSKDKVVTKSQSLVERTENQIDIVSSITSEPMRQIPMSGSLFLLEKFY